MKAHLYHTVARHVLGPALDLFRGTLAIKCLTELEQSQWWPRDRIMELQNKRLALLLEYAYCHTLYYRRIFDERGLSPAGIKDITDLAKLPVLTRQQVRTYFNDLLSQGFPARQRVELATGGSTGEPLVFCTTRHDHIALGFAAVERIRSGVGIALGDKGVHLTNNYPVELAGARFWKKPINFFLRTLPVDTNTLSPANMPRLLKRIEAFRPEFFFGTPSAIYQVARWMQAEGKKMTGVRAVFSGAEQLFDHQRELFREMFGCETYDCYGAREQHIIAFQCEQRSRYHISAENTIVEVVDDGGKPVPSGEEGRILVTNLNNYAMPFIRYEVGDRGAVSDQACSCGRGLPLLAALKGRTYDSIVTRSRGTVPGVHLYQLFRRLARLGVAQCQIVQETRGELTVNVVLGLDQSAEHKRRVEREIVELYSRILGEDMEITTEFVEYIVPTAAGKQRFIVSKAAQ